MMPKILSERENRIQQQPQHRLKKTLSVLRLALKYSKINAPVSFQKKLKEEIEYISKKIEALEEKSWQFKIYLTGGPTIRDYDLECSVRNEQYYKVLEDYAEWKKSKKQEK